MTTEDHVISLKSIPDQFYHSYSFVSMVLFNQMYTVYVHMYISIHVYGPWLQAESQLFMNFTCKFTSVLCIHPWLYPTVASAKELHFWMDGAGCPFINVHHLNKSW